MTELMFSYFHSIYRVDRSRSPHLNAVSVYDVLKAYFSTVPAETVREVAVELEASGPWVKRDDAALWNSAHGAYL